MQYILYVNWLLFNRSIFRYGHGKIYQNLSVIQHHWQGVYLGLTGDFSVTDFIM